MFVPGLHGAVPKEFDQLQHACLALLVPEGWQGRKARVREIIIYATINNVRASAQLARWPLAGAAEAASNQNFTAGRSKQVAYALTTAS